MTWQDKVAHLEEAQPGCVAAAQAEQEQKAAAIEAARVQKEQERLAKEKADKLAEEQREAARDRQALLAQDPKARRAVYSAEICWFQSDRQEVIAAIAKERRYSKIGGVVDMKYLYERQEAVRRDDDAIANMRAELKKERVGALPCSDKLVAALTPCMTEPLGYEEDAKPSHCSDLPYADYLGLVSN